MPDRSETARIALEALYSVIDELNLELPEEQRLAKEPSTHIFGGEGDLASIDLVRLVVLYEQELAEAAQCAISISDDRAMSETHSRFSTVRSLADYATQLIEEEGGVD